MARADRTEIIKKLEEKRHSKVITYIAATRPGLSYSMRQLDIRFIQDILLSIGSSTKIDLYIHSFGGDVTFAWRLVNLIREYTSDFNVIIPLHAFSSATLISLGADTITMLPAACLGPTDPQSNNAFNPRDAGRPIPINVEDINSYVSFVKENFEIKSEEGLIESLKLLSQSDGRIHPLALGASKRGFQLAKKYAQELLSLHKKKKIKKEKISKLVKIFGTELYAHDHPINRDEAEKYGLNIKKETPQIEKLIWQLYEQYEKDMNLTDPFDPVSEFKNITPTIEVGKLQQNTIPPVNLAIIENTRVSYTLQQEYDVNGAKYIDGGSINEVYNFILKSEKWIKDIT